MKMSGWIMCVRWLDMQSLECANCLRFSRLTDVGGRVFVAFVASAFAGYQHSA